MRLMYIVLSHKDDETMAKKWTKQFNKKFGTNYEWADLYGIDSAYFDAEGYRI